MTNDGVQPYCTFTANFDQTVREPRQSLVHHSSAVHSMRLDRAIFVLEVDCRMENPGPQDGSLLQPHEDDGVCRSHQDACMIHT